MLRSASEAEIKSGKRLGLASFPLVPWSNRIGGGHFRWGGRDLQITLNFVPEPHAIHGIGWDDAWQVEVQGAASITLALDHAGDARWPWPFSARQTLTVEENSLTISLSAWNNAAEPAPLAVGHHPYFDLQGASLWFNAKRVWMNGDDMLPTTAQPTSGMFDFSEHGALESRAVDHCFAGWDGKARIAWEGRPRGLIIISDLPAAVVYVPQGGDRFCFEPVPHSNNALNRDDADPPMPIVAPGESFEAVIRFSAETR
jgi:aldose 1-epimerase